MPNRLPQQLCCSIVRHLHYNVMKVKLMWLNKCSGITTKWKILWTEINLVYYLLSTSIFLIQRRMQDSLWLYIIPPCCVAKFGIGLLLSEPTKTNWSNTLLGSVHLVDILYRLVKQPRYSHTIDTSPNKSVQFAPWPHRSVLAKCTSVYDLHMSYQFLP